MEAHRKGLLGRFSADQHVGGAAKPPDSGNMPPNRGSFGLRQVNLPESAVANASVVTTRLAPAGHVDRPNNVGHRHDHLAGQRVDVLRGPVRDVLHLRSVNPEIWGSTPNCSTFRSRPMNTTILVLEFGDLSDGRVRCRTRRREEPAQVVHHHVHHGFACSSPDR